MEKQDLRHVSSLYGGFWDFDFEDFCYLTNPYFPPEAFLESLQSRLVELVKSYPSTNWHISSLVAKPLGLTEKEVVIANGASELISAISNRFVKHLAVPIPTFDEYINRAKDQGKAVSPYPMDGDFELDIEGFVEHVKKSGANAALVVTPNNPTGALLPYESIRYLLESLRQIDLVLIDESFLDFADYTMNPSAMGMIHEFPNLVIIKSLSKVYGIPGLRLGYAVTGDPDRATQLRRDVPIWSINSLAQYFLAEMPKYQQEFAESCEAVKRATRVLYSELQAIPYLHSYPTQANFVLCRLLNGLTSAELTRRLFDDHRILINDSSSKAGLDNRYVRIASCSAEQNSGLIKALHEITDSVPGVKAGAIR